MNPSLIPILFCGPSLRYTGSASVLGGSSGPHFTLVVLHNPSVKPYDGFTEVTDADGVSSLSGAAVTVSGALGTHLVTYKATSSGGRPDLPLTVTVTIRAVIVLSKSDIDEDAANGATIGTLSVVGGTGSYNFSVTDDPDGLFDVTGGALDKDGTLDYEVATSHQVEITADNGAGSVIVQTFTITVNNVAPVLSNATDTKTGQTTATLTWDTTETSGTLYWIIPVSGATLPANNSTGKAQIKAGLDGDGNPAAKSGTLAISASGTKTINITGLTAGTTYGAATAVHSEGAPGFLDSNVLSGDGFTTDSSNPFLALDAILSGNSGAYWDPATSSSCWQDTGKTTPAGNGDPVRVIEDLSGQGHDFVAPADASRPTRTQGGGGEWYLDFGAGGTAKMKAASYQLTKTTEGGWFTGAAVYTTSSLATVQSYMTADRTDATRIAQFLRANSAAFEVIAFTSGASPGVDSGGTLSTSTFYRLTGEAAYNAGSETVQSYIDGVAQGGATSIADLTAGASQALCLFVDETALGVFGQYAGGRFYRGFHVDRELTAGEKTSVDTFLNGNRP
jgi:hypothetical protein